MFQGFLRIIYGFIFLLFGLLPSQAADAHCPKEIASIEGDPLGDIAGQILVSVYKELGCEITILARPGLRGVADFNKGRVDGELFRLELVEAAYERGFVRSKTGLFSLRNGMWVHEEVVALSSTKIIGYVPGIRWHEKVTSENLKGYIFTPFHTETELHKAFSDRKIMGFLSEKQTIDLLMDRGMFEAYPTENLTFGERPLYHYLGKEYREFMNRFSDYIAKENPYQHLN